MKESLRQHESRISRLTIRRLAELLKPHQSGWVALSSDEREVLAAAETLHETRKLATTPDAIFVKVIPPTQGYLPLLS